jgi:small subunit ribosomal protein S16
VTFVSTDFTLISYGKYNRMVVIRLSRGGAKKRPFYNIVVSDRRRARDGRCIERIGYFNPIAAGKEVRLHMDHERAMYWVSQGAQPSDRVHKLIKNYEKEAKTGEANAAQ